MHFKEDLKKKKKKKKKNSHDYLKQLEQLLRSIYLEGEGSYVKYDSQIRDSHLGYLLKL